MRRIARISPPSRRPRNKSAARVEPLEGRQLLAAELVSVNLAGTGPGNGASFESSVSGNGRYVAFTSTSTDLVDGDTNGFSDIFLRDRHTNTTILVSKGIGGVPADAESFEPKINNDGTFVVFATRAANIIPGDTPATSGGSTDVVRYNIATGALELVSIRQLSTNFPQGGSGEPSISSDGRFVAFTSFAGNLGVNDQNDVTDVIVRDMTKTGVGSLVLVSATPAGPAGDNHSLDPQISDDGNFVSFRSDATNLVTNDGNGLRDTFVRNISAGTTTLVSVSPTTGVAGDQPSESNSISGDGKFVAFRSLATNLAANDTNGTQDIFLRNTETNVTTLLTVNRFGTASARGSSEFPWLSADGGAAVFNSDANDLIDGDNNALQDIFLRDLRNGPIYLISTNAAGNAGGNGASSDPYISREGKFISFTSEASDLTAIADANAKSDIFIQVAPNNPGDPDDPDTDPFPGAGPPPNPTPNPTPTPTPTPTDPNPGGPDVIPPLVALAATQRAPNQGSLEYQFDVSLVDERNLNTLVLGNLTVTKQGGSPQTATLVNVVGSGKQATATYKITFANPLSSADNGTYVVDLPADAIKDAAGNSAAAGSIGNFALNVGSPTDPDLSVAITTKATASALVLGTRTAKGTARVTVTNNGPTDISKRPVPVTLFLSDNQSRDAADIQLAAQTKTLTLKVGKSKNLNFKFTYPTTAGTGNYFLIPEVDSGNSIVESNEANNTPAGSALPTVSLATPFIDLRSSAISTPIGDSRAGGRAASVVGVLNDGNVKLSQTVRIRITASTDDTLDASDREVGSIEKRLSINPKATKSVPVRFVYPLDLASNTYRFFATIDPADAIDETSESNNDALSNNSVTIS